MKNVMIPPKHQNDSYKAASTKFICLFTWMYYDPIHIKVDNLELAWFKVAQRN